MKIVKYALVFLLSLVASVGVLFLWLASMWSQTPHG